MLFLLYNIVPHNPKPVKGKLNTRETIQTFKCLIKHSTCQKVIQTGKQIEHSRWRESVHQSSKIDRRNRTKADLVQEGRMSRYDAYKVGRVETGEEGGREVCCLQGF